MLPTVHSPSELGTLSQPADAEPAAGGHAPRLRAELIAVTLVAAAVHAASLAATPLWVFPDSCWYVQLAVDVAERFDFSNELFQVRPPGYPLLLAAAMHAFGSASATGIQVLQHTLLIATAVLTAVAAGIASGRRSVALLAGLLVAVCPPLVAYGNVVLAEAPYCCAAAACLAALIRYHRRGGLGYLLAASACAGAAYYFRPMGLLLVGVVWLGAGHRACCATTGTRRDRGLRTAWAGLAAVLPAVLLAAPWIGYHLLQHRPGGAAGSCLTLALYSRALGIDGLDSQRSPALNEIRGVVAEAEQCGALAAGADYRDWTVVASAYRAVRGADLDEVGVIAGRAAVELYGAQPGLAVKRTLTHTARNLLMPDGMYRVVPGGAMGDGTRMAKGAELFSIASYYPFLAEDIAGFAGWLPLHSEPRPLTPLWNGLMLGFRRHVDKGPPLLGVGDSVYEELVCLGVLGGLATLFTRQRWTWLLAILAWGGQIFAASALGGTQPRYATPTLPILAIFMAFALVLASQLVVHAGRSVSRRIIRPASAPANLPA